MQLCNLVQEVDSFAPTSAPAARFVLDTVIKVFFPRAGRKPGPRLSSSQARRACFAGVGVV